MKRGDMPRVHTRVYPVVVKLAGFTWPPDVPSTKALCDVCSQRVCWVPRKDLDDLPLGEAIKVVCATCVDEGRWVGRPS